MGKKLCKKDLSKGVISESDKVKYICKKCHRKACKQKQVCKPKKS
ncbi:MAG: hypothetical protein N4A72_17595 [Bacteroidales bacterium]|nr:hypothetical protein [Bacteroidales bacterium]